MRAQYKCRCPRTVSCLSITSFAAIRGEGDKEGAGEDLGVDGGSREGTRRLWGQLCCWNANAILLEMCSEGKDHCSCSLLKMPTLLTSLPLSSTRRVDSRCNSEPHSSSEPHSMVPLKTDSGTRMAQGGERKDQSYSDVSPLRNIYHFFRLLPCTIPRYTHKALWRYGDRVPSFSKK